VGDHPLPHIFAFSVVFSTGYVEVYSHEDEDTPIGTPTLMELHDMEVRAGDRISYIIPIPHPNNSKGECHDH